MLVDIRTDDQQKMDPEKELLLLAFDGFCGLG